MKNILYKEFRLAVHPTGFLFLAMPLMLLIPNYPYYVAYFYMTLALFFTCLSGRENHDIAYTMTLPVRKRDLVRGRMTAAVVLEVAEILLSVPMILLRSGLDMPGNAAGMDANTAMLGVALGMLGGFNLVFFTKYYRNPNQVGVPFIAGSALFFGMIAVATVLEVSPLVPFVRDKLDTPDPQFMAEKLLVLAGGILLFAGLTLLSMKKAEKTFEKIDL